MSYYDKKDVRETYLTFYEGSEKVNTIRIIPFHKVIFIKGSYPDSDYIYSILKISDIDHIFYNHLIPFIKKKENTINKIKFSDFWEPTGRERKDVKYIQIFEEDDENILFEKLIKFLIKKTQEWFYSEDKEFFIPATKFTISGKEDENRKLLAFPWPSYYKYQQMISGTADYLLVDTATLKGTFIKNHNKLIYTLKDFIKDDLEFVTTKISSQIIDFYENRIRSDKVNFLNSKSPFNSNSITINTVDDDELQSLITQSIASSQSDFCKYFSSTVPFTKNDRIRDLNELKEAIEENNDDTFEYLIEDININSIYNYKDPFIFKVIDIISLDSLQTLIGWGLDVFSIDNNGDSLIYKAMQLAEDDIVKELFDYTNVDLENEEFDEYDEMLDNPNWKKQFQITPIDFFRLLKSAKSEKSLELILNDGFDVNSLIPQTGKTILHLAVESSYPISTIKFLINHDANPTIKSRDGEDLLSSKLEFKNKKHEELYNKSIDFINKNSNFEPVIDEPKKPTLQEIIDTHVTASLKSKDSKTIEKKIEELNELLEEENASYNPKFSLFLDDTDFFMRAYIEDGRAWMWIVDGNNTSSKHLLDIEVTIDSSMDEKKEFEAIMDYMINNSEIN